MSKARAFIFRTVGTGHVGVRPVPMRGYSLVDSDGATASSGTLLAAWLPSIAAARAKARELGRDPVQVDASWRRHRAGV